MEALLRLTASEWSELIAAGAALAALLVSLWSVRIARESLRIASVDHRGRQPRLLLYLQTGYIRASAARGSRIYAISLSISNTSGTDNSVSRIELVVQHRKNAGPIIDVLLPHDPELAVLLQPSKDLTPFRLPLAIPAHHIAAGWSLFELSNALVEDASVERYMVRATDPHEAEYEATPNVLTEIADERQMAASPDSTSRA